MKLRTNTSHPTASMFPESSLLVRVSAVVVTWCCSHSADAGWRDEVMTLTVGPSVVTVDDSVFWSWWLKQLKGFSTGHSSGADLCIQTACRSNRTNLPVPPDPTMTVRADINGRYSNRMYAYEPSDIKLCKWRSHTAVLPSRTSDWTLTIVLSVDLSVEQHEEGQEAAEVRAVSQQEALL